MKHHLNTLFVTTQGAYLFKQGEAVVVRVERENKLRVPLNNLGSITCFGRVSCSPPLLGVCGQRGGAYWGESGIPKEWLEKLARRDMIEKTLDGLLKGTK